MDRSRGAHRILGLILLAPICAWASTGFVFFVKPGYAAAYGSLRAREYPLEAIALPSSQPGWLEVRLARTVLGDHLLVRTAERSIQIDPATLRARPLPEDAAIRRLIEDAVASDRSRYGKIASIVRHDGEPPSASITTSTGASIDLDWSTLSLQQSGRDTRRIDALYRIHYLQWTGVRSIDRVLGVGGLASLVVLAILGVRLAFLGRR